MHEHSEIWLLKATPTDPAKAPFLLGDGTLIAHSKEEAERNVARSMDTLRNNGVESVEAVRVGR